MPVIETAESIRLKLADSAYLYSLARRIVSKLMRPDTLEPLDAQHDAIVHIMTMAPKYPAARASYLHIAFEPWVVKTVRYLLQHDWRDEHAWSRGRASSRALIESDGDRQLFWDPLQPEANFDPETIMTFQWALSKLSPRSRKIVEMRCAGEPLGEIGRKYRVMASMVKVWLHRIQQEIEELVNPGGT